MSSYRSHLWSKAGIVERVFQPAASESDALLARITRMGKVALRLRGLRAKQTNTKRDPTLKIRAAARFHLLRAQRLLRELNEPECAAKAGSLRASLKQT